MNNPRHEKSSGLGESLDAARNQQPSARLEWQYFLSAVMFYTRIPVPRYAQHSQSILNKSRKYFSLIGIIVGSFGFLTFSLAALLFTNGISLAISMIATILLTGAFHEDGFADSCDGLGGGWSKEQILTIMKDSRVGTYATVGLISILGLKFLLLLDINTNANIGVFGLSYICGHSFSRQLSSSVIERHDYVQDIDISKVKPITAKHLSVRDQRTSMLITALPLLLLGTQNFGATMTACLAAALAAFLFMRYCEKRIGGYTGDVLGATQQLSEVMFYLTILALI